MGLQVIDIDLLGDRRLHLVHNMRNGIPLEDTTRNSVLEHLRYLWGYDVTLNSIS